MIGNRIIGPDEIFSFEDRTLNAVLFCAAVLGFLSFCGDVLQNMGPTSYLYSLGITIAYGTLYAFGRVKPDHKRLILIFCLINITPTIYVWYFLNGIEGPAFIFLLVFVFIIPIIIQGYMRIVVVTGAFILATILLVIELQYPEVVHRYDNHETEIIDIYLSTIISGTGTVLVLSLILHNFYEQRKKVELLNRTKDKFFSIISHDLKGPLGALTQLGEMIWKNSGNKDESANREISKLIYENSKKTYDLLGNLLQWAQSESGILVAHEQNLPLKSLVEKNLHLLSEMAQAKNIRIKTRLDPGLEVFADENMLHTVVRNLLSNAIKFTAEGGLIQIYSESDTTDKKVNLKIKDSGIGMEKEVVQTLFDIDSHHITKGTNDEVGTGLGLKLSKEFIVKNHGDIEVESAVGQGTVFTITLPASIKKSGD